VKERFEQIRQLLNQLEELTGSSVSETSDRNFSALELPLIIQEIVDDLQPLLTAYQAAFYWYLFRHSIAKNGNPLLRMSTSGMQVVVRSSRGAETISGQQVRDTLTSLQSMGAIRKEGEPNRDGTLYRIFIPDEIEACRKFRAERTAAEPKAEVLENEADYYNVRENRIKIYERDEYKCRYCGKQLTRFTATIDHVKPVAEEGDNSFDNLVTACLDCNSRKHKRPVGDFLAEK
jgi:hypothetical protein